MKKMSDNDSVVLGQKRQFKEIFRDQRIMLLILIVLIAVVVGCINPRFFGIKNIVQIFQQIAVGGLLTMGMAMLLLNGGLDLSIGNIMILAGCTMSILITGGPDAQTTSSIDSVESVLVTNNGLTSVPVAILIGLLVAVGCGIVNGFIVSKSKCMPLIITLGMSNVYYGIALFISQGKFLPFKMAFESLRVLKIGSIIPVTLIIFLALVFIAWLLVNRTKYGRRLVAIGGNEENARLSGIKVDKYKIITYTISGLYCGIAAILYASRLDSITAGGGAGYELTALTGAVIGGITFDGGKGTITGAFLGTLFMGLVSNAMNVLSVDTFIQTIVSGLIVVIAVVISNIDNIRKK